MINFKEFWCLLDIVLSIVLGFCIGFERKLRSKEAGIRTHTIVCMGSALMMVVSKYAFADFPDHDPARIAAQIVSGIGFLGAGIIVYRKYEIHGLTTAAGVWATAGVGMACGGGLYIIAIGSAILLIAFQVLLHANWKLFRSKNAYRLRVAFNQTKDEADVIKEIFEVEHFHKFHVERKGDEVKCEVVIFTESEYSSEKLNEYMSEYPFITYIERVDE